ncbi:MAG TPA: IclR family transcriptional regulator [Anaerolineales bacterium]|nr:IclR family transcriptional regulator [Anaerolineales bacterium]
MMTRDEPNESILSQTVLKALDVLECIANADEPVSAPEVAKLLKISRPTAYRLIATLVSRGYVAEVDDARFHLGTQALSLGTKVLGSMDLPEVSRAYMRQLSDLTNETINLSIREGTEILYIARVEGSQSIRMTSTIGTRSHLHSTSMGKAILAFLPEEEQTQLMEKLVLTAHTPATITQPELLFKELANVCKQGFAIDDEENETGVRCLGAPIFDHAGYAFAGISISGPAYRTSVAQLRALSRPLIEAANAISARLGHAPG